MKKLRTSLVSVLAAVCCCLTSLVGCAPKIPDNENTLEIYATSAGYGIEWINDLIPIFEEQNPGMKVYLNYDIGVELCNNMLTAGPKSNTADLMFSLEDWGAIVMRGANGVAGYDYALEDLTDFLDEEDENGETLRERFIDYTLSPLGIELDDGKVHDFALPWASAVTGIIYNKNIFSEHPEWLSDFGGKTPRTTDELIAMCYKIAATDSDTSGKKLVAFCNDSVTGYLSYISYILFAQYLNADTEFFGGFSGAGNFYDYYNPIRTDDAYKLYSSSGTLGRLYTLQVMKQICNTDDGILSPTVAEDDYSRAQGRLVSRQGVMSINGDWFDNEMSTAISQARQQGNNYESGLMRTPVISAISDKLSYFSAWLPGKANYNEAQNDPAGRNGLDACDKMLAKIVDYVDGGKTGELPSHEYGGVSLTATQNDIRLVENARKMFSSLGSGHTAVIPAYSNAKPLAKKFLKLLYGKEGCEVFLNRTKGGILPVKQDVAAWSGYSNATSLQKDIYAAVQECTAIQYRGAAWRITGLPEPTATFINASYTPEQKFEMDSLTKSTFDDIMRQAGL